MKRGRWIPQVYGLEVRKSLSYRADFWVNFAGSVIVQLGLAYFLWKAVYEFRGVDELGGYSFRAMMLYYLLVPLMEKITRGHEMGFMSHEIYDGGLTRYLVYPVDFFAYKYVSQLAVASLAVAQMALGLGLYALLFGLPPEIALTPLSAARGLIAALGAGVLYFLLAACLEMLAFWADNVWSLLVMLRFGVRLLGGGMIPLSLFPDWSQNLLAALPFPYLLSYPIRLFMGDPDVSPLGFAWMLAWALIAFLIARSIWRRGTLQYTGVGI